MVNYLAKFLPRLSEETEEEREERCPVAFSSLVMSQTEQTYAQIEKELLAKNLTSISLEEVM